MNDDCLKLTTYFGSRDRGQGGFVADILLNFYSQAKLQISVLFLGAEGFGLRRHLYTDCHAEVPCNRPMVSIAVDTRERIESALEAAPRLKEYGLVTVERARLLTGNVEEIALQDVTKLNVYLRRDDKVFGQPAFVAICDVLYRRGLTGATVLGGVDGMMNGTRTCAKAFSSHSKAPMVVTVIGAGEQVRSVIPELDGLLRRPLITLEPVQICKHDGELHAHPHPSPGHDAEGIGMLQKLSVYASGLAKDGKPPLHSALIRRLRKSGSIAGVTSLRGTWGFHGDHAPHGDRPFQLHRHAPMVTTMVDSSKNIGDAFEIVDELTAHRGLVTNEMVTGWR